MDGGFLGFSTRIMIYENKKYRGTIALIQLDRGKSNGFGWCMLLGAQGENEAFCYERRQYKS